MGTYKDLQDTVNSDFLNRDMGETTKRAILRAVRKYDTERGWFNETATSYACVANQSYLSVPSDFWDLDRLEITIGGQQTELIEVPFDHIRIMNTTGQAWQPTHFAYRADRFELAMIPDSAYPVLCYYVQHSSTLSAEADTAIWTQEAFNLIAYEAAVDIVANVLIGNPQQIASLKAERDESLSRWNEYKAQRLVSSLRPTSF